MLKFTLIQKSPDIDDSDPRFKDTNISLPSLPPNFDESLETNLPSSPRVLPIEENETAQSPTIKTEKLQTMKIPEPDSVNIPESSVKSLVKSPNRKKPTTKSIKARKQTNIKKLFSQRSTGKFTELDMLDSLKASCLTEIRINEAFNLLSKLPNIPREPVIWGLLKKLNDRGQIIMEMPKRRTRTSKNTILLLE